jgi:GNAT superfamily N-acetyltransferase
MAPPPAIRPATEADVEALFDIRTSVRENHLGRAELDAMGITADAVARMLRTRSRAWLAEVEGQPVAFAMADAAQGTVFALFVRPGYEGRGLLHAAEAWLFAQGWTELWLLTGGDPQIRAHGFYRRAGWQDAGLQPDGQRKYVRRRS